MMFYNEKYQMAMDLLQETGNLSLLQTFNGLPPEERVAKMEEFFLYAATLPNDSVAAAYFSFLMQSISDRELWEFIESEGGKTVLRYSFKNVKEFRATQANAGKIQALETMRLYARLPVIANNIGLPKTQSAMLAIVAGQWRKTEDEKEANDLFSFLSGQLAFPGEEKTLYKILQDATDKGFPADRLSRHFAQLLPPCVQGHHGIASDLYEIASILVKGWARNCDLSKSSKALRACQPLLERKEEHDFKTVPAFDLLTRAATEIAEMDLAVQELFGSFGTWGSDSVPGKKSVFYPDAKRAEILIKITVSMGNYHQRGELLQKDGHKWFEAARDRAREWRRKYPQYSVYLKMVVTGEFSPAPRFGRDEEIDL